jgi:hypothetical protein
MYLEDWWFGSCKQQVSPLRFASVEMTDCGWGGLKGVRNCGDGCA